MDAEDILDGVIRGALGGRRKRHRGTLGYLVGGRHSLINARTILAAAGVAWGVYEATKSPASASSSPRPTPPLPPPLPRPPAAVSSGAAADPRADLLRLVRLTISAARADGNLALEERGQILERAREAGLETEVAAELQQPRALAEIVAGVDDTRLKEDMYRLAFAIARADETVSGAERVFLAQLAAKLGLDTGATSRIESEAAAAIDAAAREGRS